MRPTGAGLDSIGVAVALAGVVCSSIAYVTVRKLSRTEHPLVIVFYFPLIATPLALPWMIGSFVLPRPIDWLLLMAIGATTQVGQVFLTMGLAIERAGRATTVGYLQVAFAMLWQLAVFGEAPTAWTLGGAGGGSRRGAAPCASSRGRRCPAPGRRRPDGTARARSC